MGDSIRRLLAIAFKEVRQLRRDHLTLGMIIGVPLLQIVLFGYAVDFDVREIGTGVVDQANTTRSRQLIAAAEQTQIARITHRAGSPAQLQRMLDRGQIDIGIAIPPDFERRLIRREQPAAQLLINGSDPTVARIAANLANLPFPATSRQRAAGVFETRTFYNPEARSPVHIIPGLIGIILHLTLVLFTAIAIVRERERGTLELLITTPVRTSEVMLGKILPYVVIGMLQVTIILAVSSWLFDIPMRGSLADLYLASGLFILAALALGLTVSTLAQNQFQAMQLTVFTFLPSILLSGFMFPFDGMPEVAQWLAEAIPLTHFVRLSRGVLVRGTELASMPMDIAAMAVFFVLLMTIAIARFRKRLD